MEPESSHEPKEAHNRERVGAGGSAAGPSPLAGRPTVPTGVPGSESDRRHQGAGQVRSAVEAVWRDAVGGFSPTPPTLMTMPQQRHCQKGGRRSARDAAIFQPTSTLYGAGGGRGL